MVSVSEALLAPGVTEAGENPQVAFAGSAAQAKVTAFENVPPTAATDKLKVAVAPALMVVCVVVALTLKSTPVPVRLTVCGLTVALSFTVSVPVRLPVAVGVSTTLMVQVDPAVNVAGQLLLWLKSPVICALPMLTDALPVFVTVTGWEALATPSAVPVKVRLVGVTERTNVEATAPVPDRLTVCGLPVSLSVTVRVPVREPDAVGVNTTLMVQCAPDARLAPQLLDCVKSPLM